MSVLPLRRRDQRPPYGESIRRGPPAQDEDGCGWSSADDTLHYAERLDSTLHTVVELSGGDLKRRNVQLGAAFTTAAFVETALFALTTPGIRALQQQIQSLHSGDLAELDEEITDFPRRAHADEAVTT